MKNSLPKLHVNIPLKTVLLLIIWLFIFNNSSAQTYVSGGIYSNTTWTTVGSPYIVNANLVVFPGVTLTIQPGVTVKVDTDVQFEIRQATLLALGTSADSITFMGGNATTSNDREWRSIDLIGKPLTSSRFSYCHFTHATNGIFDEQDTGTLYVSHSLFTDNHCGLLPKFSPVQVDSCNFINNVWGYGENSGWGSAGGCSVNACNFFYNTNGLYEMSPQGPPYPALTVTNCVFEYNIGPGADGLIYALVNNCVAKYNNCGISCYHTGGNGQGSVIRNSIMDSNVTGTTLAENDSILNCSIEYNTVGINDIYNQGNQNNVIQSNIIDNNMTGLSLKEPNNHFSCNSICNNSLYNVEYTGTSNTSIAFNYWCLPDSVQIRATITDGHQNISYGLMFITPFDTVACTNGCNLFVSATATKTVVCAGDSTVLTAHVMDVNSVYTAVWNPGSHTGTTFTVTPLVNTTYTVVVTDSGGCTNTAYVTIDTSCTRQPPVCNLTVTAISTYSSVCRGDSTILYANITDANNVYVAVWNPGNYSGQYYHVTPSATTTYTVVVTDSSGCKDTSNVTVYVVSCGPPNPCNSLSPPSICYVTVDTSSTFNTVLWQKTGMDTLAIDSIVIYRQNILDNYVQIGEVSVHAFSSYHDYTAHPLIEPYFYKLGIVDTCGRDTTLSNFNETVFLQSSVGSGHNIANLNWNFYQGTPVIYYRIFRDDSGTGNWHAIDSVQGSINAYTDRNAPENPGLRYLVNIDWDIACTPSKIRPPHIAHHFEFNTNNVAYSNMTYLFPTGIKALADNNSIKVYPNPVNDAISISFGNAFEGLVKITDVLGQNVYTTTLSAENGSVKKINVNALPSGVYFITLESNGKLYRTKIIKM
jgi:hypothetical protein